MTVVNRDNTRVFLTTLLVLAITTLACGQQIATPGPDNTPTTPPATVVTVPAATRTAIVPSATPRSTDDNTATVVKAVVNVRAEPDNTSEAVGYLASGDRVQVLQCKGSWCEIEDPAGWVWRGCLSDNPDNLKCEAKP